MRKKSQLISLSAIFAVVLAGCMASSTRRTLTGNFTAAATANMSSMMGGMVSPMLNFTFSMAEGPMMMNMGASPRASVSISNLNFSTGSNCFDNMAMATAMVAGAAGSNRTLTLMLSENGNTAMFSMAVPSNNSSASGSFALTGGNMIASSTTPCMANASGTAVFTRR